jgi:hypothetical protein
MPNLFMLRAEPNFLSIPIDQAMYCDECRAINNSSNERCGRCGGDSLTKVVVPVGGPPEGPEPGSAPAHCIPPAPTFELLGRAA